MISPAGAVVAEETFFAPNKLTGGVDAAQYPSDRSLILNADNSHVGVVAAAVAGFRPKRPVAGTIQRSIFYEQNEGGI